MTAGRPSGYRKAFGATVEDYMAQGFSKMAAAGHIGICYNTMKDWMEKHPEFMTAVKRGEAKRVSILETALLEAETGPKVTSRIFALKNAAPDEWRDRTSVEMTGANNGPIRTESASLERLMERLDAVSERSRAAGGAADGGQEGGLVGDDG